MSEFTEALEGIKEIQDGLVNNKVARFSYTQNAYDTNTVDGVNEYNVNNEQNIPNGTTSIMKVNSTILDKGYRAQASSITRMLMNHFLGRISYNLNKINDNMQSLLNILITKFPTSLPANGGNADTATKLKTARTINIQDSTATNTGTEASFDGSRNVTIKLPATIKADIIGHATYADTAVSADNTRFARFADTAGGVEHSLTFGTKLFTGSSDQRIEASDLGLLPPDLTKVEEVDIVTAGPSELTLVPFTVPSDGWILTFYVNAPVNYFICIDGFGLERVTPSQIRVGSFKDTNNSEVTVLQKNLNCPYPVKKGQTITVDYSNLILSSIKFAPCIVIEN